MSFFSGTRDVPQPKQKPFGLDESRLPTSEAGRPLPWHCGTAILGATFISEVYKYKSEPIETEAGKERQQTGTRHYASFAAKFCHGVGGGNVSLELQEIRIDDEIVWTGTLTDGGNDYTDITIEDRGVVRLYWGTETQVLDDVVGSTDDLVGSGQNHGAYRGQVIMVARQILWGDNHTSAPAITIKLKRIPDPSWMTADPDMSGDCNPIAAVWDLWRNHRAGLGQSDAQLNTTEFDALATVLNTEGLGLSPVLNSRTTFREFITMLGEYIDCFPRPARTDGKFSLGLKRSTDASVLTLDDDDITDFPDLDGPGYLTTFNEVHLVFSDSAIGYNKNFVAYRNRANFRIMGTPKLETLQRPWITRSVVAQKIVAAWGRRLAYPAAADRLRCKRRAAAGLQPGDVFTVTWAPQSISAERFRCLEVNLDGPKSREVEIRFEAEHSHLNDAVFVPTVDTPPVITTLTPAAPTYQRAVEMPYTPGLILFSAIFAEKLGVGLLVGRPDLSHEGLRGHYSLNASSYMPSPSGSYRFARRGTLVNDYPATTDLHDETQALRILFQTPEETLTLRDTAAQAMENVWCLLIGDEWLWPFNETLVGTKEYTMSAVRAVHGSDRLGHIAGDEVWLFELKRNIPGWAFSDTPSPVYFKAQPLILGEGVALSALTAMPVSSVRASIRPPTPKNLRDSTDNGINPTYTTAANVTVKVDDATQSDTTNYFDRISAGAGVAWADACRLQLWERLGMTTTFDAGVGPWEATSFGGGAVTYSHQYDGSDGFLRAVWSAGGTNEQVRHSVGTVWAGTVGDRLLLRFRARGTFANIRVAKTTQGGSPFAGDNFYSAVALGSTWRDYEMEITATVAGNPSLYLIFYMPNSVTGQFDLDRVELLRYRGQLDYPAAATYQITNAQIQSIMGSETSFHLRAFLGRKGWFSARADDLYIRKV